MQTWVRRLGQMTSQNSPTILSGLAIAGVITTAFLAAKAAPKAIKAHEQAKEDFVGSDSWVEDKELPKIEVLKATWKIYIPAAVAATSTIACIIGSNKIGLRRNAALVGAFTIADTAFRQYKDEVIAQFGETKARKVEDEITRKQIELNPPSKEVIILIGGDQLCFDSLTGRYFKSDIETLRQAANKINQEILNGGMYASHNEFCELVGMASTDIGNALGWNLDNFVELTFGSHIANDGSPALAVRYVRLPRTEYTKTF